MIFQSLNISLKSPYSKPGPTNPYTAKLDVSYNDNRMTVQLQPDTCARILAMVGGEIAAAAQVQISDFVSAALSVASSPLIEAKADAPVEPEMPF